MCSLITLALVAVLTPQSPQAGGYELVDAFPAQAKFNKPLLLEHHESDPGRYYVVEQDGMVFRIPSDGAASERDVFLDWTERAYHGANWEEGLLGLAFDPDYTNNRFVYIYYSEKVEERKRRSVISRLSVARSDDGPPRVDPASELVLMHIPQPFGNHNGGTILFGPDGMLYVALGDGGKANDPFGNGQNLETLLGSILRIDVRGATAAQRYRVPDDNPFAAMDGGARGEIWAWGMRNPWRITFDRKTGDLWCGDVGQNRWEEVHRVVRGGNHGWNFVEGTHDFNLRKQGGEKPADLIAPVVEYSRKFGISITGGYVYRGTQLPELDGYFIYGDFMSCRLWGVREDRKGGEPDVTELGKGPRGQLASFAAEPDGELLALFFNPGRIYRLVHKEQ